jgi:hypothetical protein
LQRDSAQNQVWHRSDLALAALHILAYMGRTIYDITRIKLVPMECDVRFGMVQPCSRLRKAFQISFWAEDYVRSSQPPTQMWNFLAER